jgi:hypothetical protein
VIRIGAVAQPPILSTPEHTMRKLKLESLQVETFETTPAARQDRGTVDAHGRPGPIATYNIEKCGDTNYMDCTYGCSINTACPNGCIEVMAEPNPFDVTV